MRQETAKWAAQFTGRRNKKRVGSLTGIVYK
jgi:hypothetical protein